MNTQLNKEQLLLILRHLQQCQRNSISINYEARINRLNKLNYLLQQFSAELAKAISKDFTHRSINETKLFDIVPAIGAINYIKKNLYKWMKPEKRKIPWYLQRAKAYIQYQPLGVVGIVVPFNYPIQLLFIPLAYALAAGNVCMVNISERLPTYGQRIIHYLSRTFSSDELFTLYGNIDIAKEFTKLPFDHLFFTGSNKVGKSLLRNNAYHLVPSTLELGGKSPAMIAPNYPLKKAIKPILYSKLVNSGQSCIATDYVILPEENVNEFINLAKYYVKKFYPDIENNIHYSNIINITHCQRLQELLNDAKTKGAHLIPLLSKNTREYPQRFYPYLLINVNENMLIMKEEIFGPILPILTYKNWQEGYEQCQQANDPLIVYYFDNNKKHIKQFVTGICTGNISINSTLVQMAVNDLPFGGIGESGMGRYHGKEGFLCFSNQQSIFKQRPFNFSTLFMPPYKPFFSTQLLHYLFSIRKK